MEYEIYTDGACSKNPGPGGYAFIILVNKKEWLRVKGHKAHTTNNEMELTAIVKAIQHTLIHPNGFNKNTTGEQKITIYSDSAYCLNAINQKWINSWALNGWKNKEGKEIKNKELWQKTWHFLNLKNVEYEFIKVKGHSGNEFNELVDVLAKSAVKKEI